MSGFEWRPIDTAPKDGTKFDAWLTFKSGKSSPYRKPDVWWCDRRQAWTWEGQWSGRLGPDIELTHWMPSPASPRPAEEMYLRSQHTKFFQRDASGLIVLVTLALVGACALVLCAVVP